MELKTILSRFEEIACSPKKMVDEYIKATGKKAIGCLPVYTPEEIVYAADMLPVGLWGGPTEVDLAKQYFPAFACSIMQSCMEYGLKGSYNNLSGVIIPGMCDTLICMSQNWKSGITQIPMITFVHPQNRKIKAGVEYLVAEYQNVKKQIEAIRGSEITEQEITKAIEVYNEHRAVMRDFVELTASHLNTIDSKTRSNVIKSSYFMRKDEHTALVKELNEMLKAMPEEKYTGKTILATGIIMDSKEILDLFEENNIRIAYDNLAQETRQFRTDVPQDGECALERLANQWRDIEGCSLAYDPQKKRGHIIVDEVKNRKIDGVVYAMMKFCDPEEYDYPIIKQDLEKAEIPHLCIEIDQQTSNNEQVRTRIQTFAEILG